jgi:hypothetical protein
MFSGICIKKRCCVGLLRRSYATMATPPPPSDQYIDHHIRLQLHEWPKSKVATPYEIFGIQPLQKNLSQLEFNKLLKEVYQKYIKIYHPDVSRNLQIKDHQGKILDETDKRNRYDQIQNAYEILKDPRRRVAYSRYSTTSWDKYTSSGGVYSDINQNNAKSFHAFRTANAHRYANFEALEQFWQAGLWEDFYRMKYNRKPPTEEEINKNKMKILFGVLAFGGLAFGLQLMLAIEKTNEYIRQTNLMNLKAMQDLNQSYLGQGPGYDSTQFQRINRFLIDRRLTIINNGENEEEIKRNDYNILTKYAKNKVEKFDRLEKGTLNHEDQNSEVAFDENL